jgi:DnaK suppressor protein
VAKPVSHAAAKPAPKPPVKQAASKPAAKAPTPAPQKTVTPVAHKPPAGKTATAVAATPPRTASAVPSRSSHKNEKLSQSRMNSLASSASESGVTREDGRYALPATTNVELPKGYRPNADEEYMSPRQLAYFRNKLRDWRDQLVEESRQTMDNLREEVRDVGDEAERATRETENSLELRTRDRYRKLISKIDKALRRIEEGRYGFCEETDEEIGVDRLDARPIATLSLDAQERREHLQKQMGD